MAKRGVIECRAGCSASGPDNQHRKMLVVSLRKGGMAVLMGGRLSLQVGLPVHRKSGLGVNSTQDVHVRIHPFVGVHKHRAACEHQKQAGEPQQHCHTPP